MTTNVPESLVHALNEVQYQLGRVDNKAGMLLAGSLAAISAGVAVLAKNSLNIPATITAVTTLTAIAAAVVVLITAIRPALRGNHGFVRWATAPSASVLLNDLDAADREYAEQQAYALLNLSRSVNRKYRLVRLATDLLLGALVATVLTALLAVTF